MPDQRSAIASTLERLFPGHGAGFLDRHYLPAVPLVVHGALERLGVNPGDVEDLGELLSEAPRQPPLIAYLQRRGNTAQQIPTSPDGGRICFEAGHTVSVESALLPIGTTLAEELSNVLSTSVRAATIASQVGEAVPAHFDGLDVFVVMLKGKKRWTIAPNALLNPRAVYFPGQGSGGPRDEGTPNAGKWPRYLPAKASMQMPEAGRQTFDLSPGSVVFLPEGWWHETECLEQSLSFTLRARSPTAAEALIPALQSWLVHDPRWRTSLRLMRSLEHRGGVSEQITSLLDELPAMIAKLSTPQMLSAVLGDHYVRRSDTTCEVRRNDEGATVIVRSPSGEREIEADGSYAAALEWLTVQRSFYLEDAQRALSGLDSKEVHQLLEAAVDAHLLAKSSMP